MEHDSRYIPNVDGNEPFQRMASAVCPSLPFNIYTVFFSLALFLLSYTPKASMALMSVALRGFNPVCALNANYRVNPCKAINTHPFTSGKWVGGVKTSMMY